MPGDERGPAAAEVEQPALLGAAVVRAQAALARGRLAKAARVAEAGLQGVAGTARLALVGVWVEALVWSGRPTDAVTRVDRELSRADGTYDAWDVLRVATLGMRACADLGEPEGPGGDAVPARLAVTTAVALRAVVDRCDLAEVAMTSGRATRTAEEAEWFAERARADGWPRQADWWRTAADRWNSHDRPHREAYARWRQAEALGAEGDVDGCVEQLRLALVGAARHRPLTAAIVRSAEGRGVALEGCSVADDTDADAAAGLTPREREVMELVASGLTAAAAGRHLGISPRTVGKHLENVYTKLGANNRVSALQVLRGQSTKDHVSPG